MNQASDSVLVPPLLSQMLTAMIRCHVDSAIYLEDVPQALRRSQESDPRARHATVSVEELPCTAKIKLALF